MAAQFAAYDDIFTKQGQIDVVNMSFGSSCTRLDLVGIGKTIMEFFCRLGSGGEAGEWGLRLEDMPSVLFVAAAGNEEVDAAGTVPATL